MKHFLVCVAILFTGTCNAQKQGPETPENANPINPEALAFEMPSNVAADTIYVMSQYNSEALKFIINLTGSVTIWRGEDRMQYGAEVYMLDHVTWSANMEGGQYVTINAATGETRVFLDGEYRRYKNKS